LRPFKSHTRLARDCEYVPWDSLLENHHEVALIPPVSGG
jgi:molybdopterin converting factor small subunit